MYGCKALKDLTGQSFGCWTVLHRDVPNSGESSAFWRCQCLCGATSKIRGFALAKGKSRACVDCASAAKYASMRLLTDSEDWALGFREVWRY